MNELEKEVDVALQRLRSLQVCTMWKMPEAWQQTPCDFIGFTVVGRAVLIECKQVKRASLPISESPGLQPHQWSALRDAEACGAVALIVWRNADATVVMDWTEAHMLSSAKDRKSIRWADACPRFKVEDLTSSLQAILEVPGSPALLLRNTRAPTV